MVVSELDRFYLEIDESLFGRFRSKTRLVIFLLFLFEKINQQKVFVL